MNVCFWRRDWELIKTTILESPYEQMAKNGQAIDHANGRVEYLFKKTAIYLFKCKLTNKIKIISESNME